jgi:hypothetical protein
MTYRAMALLSCMSQVVAGEISSLSADMIVLAEVQVRRPIILSSSVSYF